MLTASGVITSRATVIRLGRLANSRDAFMTMPPSVRLDASFSRKTGGKRIPCGRVDSRRRARDDPGVVAGRQGLGEAERSRGACLVVGAGDGLGGGDRPGLRGARASSLPDPPAAPCRRTRGARRLDPRRGRPGACLRRRCAARGGDRRRSSTGSSARSDRWRSWSSTSAPMCAFPSSRRRRRSISRSGKWPALAGFWPDARRRGS